jgi:hypothetical protein
LAFLPSLDVVSGFTKQRELLTVSESAPQTRGPSLKPSRGECHGGGIDEQSD